MMQAALDRFWLIAARLIAHSPRLVAWLADLARRCKLQNVRAKLPDAAQLARAERDNDARRSGST